MKTPHLILAGLLGLSLTAQAAPNPAVDTVNRYQQEISSATGISYRFTHEGTGPLAGMFPRTEGVVKVVPSSDHSALFDRARISATSGKGDAAQVIEVAAVDDMIFSLDRANKRLLHAPTWRTGVELVNFQYLVPLALVRELQQLQPDEIHFKGEETVGDTLCIVVEAKTQMADLTLYLGKKDALLYRGVARKPDVWGNGTIEVNLRNFETKASFPESDFRITAPNGYADVEYSGQFPTLGEAAPAFSLTGFDGKAISSGKLAGNVVVLDFWATWCGPCKQSMPGLQRLHERYAGRGLTIIGVNHDERGDARAYVAKHDYTYTFATAEGSEFAESYKPNLPMVVVIDREGRMVEVFNGYFGEESDKRLEETIKSLL